MLKVRIKAPHCPPKLGITIESSETVLAAETRHTPYCKTAQTMLEIHISDIQRHTAEFFTHFKAKVGALAAQRWPTWSLVSTLLANKRSHAACFTLMTPSSVRVLMWCS